MNSTPTIAHVHLRYRLTVILALLAIGCWTPSTAMAQGKNQSKKNKLPEQVEPEEPSPAAVTYWAPRKMEMRFGLQFQANDNQCTRIHATLPLPTQWPEQSVQITSTNISPNAQYELRVVPGGAVQVVIDADAVPPGGRFDAILMVEITKSFTKAPEETSGLVIPKKIPKELNWYVGSSPYIDPKDGLVKKVVQEAQSQNPENSWKLVELMYDWVRENIEYRNGDLKTTHQALKDRKGDCEEMTGIFVALCRNAGIPARCVWIPEHCYAEFYLEDENGKGHWYPCQLAGDRQFGEMNEYRPILQKGDRFKVPEHNEKQRYLAEYFTCQQRAVGNRPPEVTQIRDLGVLQKELDALKQLNPKIGNADKGDKANTGNESK